MRTLPPALAASLASGATTLARCWRVTRRDATVLGFTDHDRDLAFDTVVHRAILGFEATERSSSSGLAIDSTEVSGALLAPGLTEGSLSCSVNGAPSEASFIGSTAEGLTALIPTLLDPKPTPVSPALVCALAEPVSEGNKVARAARRRASASRACACAIATSRTAPASWSNAFSVASVLICVQ